MSLRIAIDTGGTFTDVIAIDETTGEQIAIKTPSTPDDPSRGLINGIREVTGEDDTQLDQVLHGTTTATNAVLEHRFEGLGLLVTAGFRHIIEIARQSVPDGYGNSFGSIRDSYVFVIQFLERQEVGLWTSEVSRCGFRRRAG